MPISQINPDQENKYSISEKKKPAPVIKVDDFTAANPAVEAKDFTEEFQRSILDQLKEYPSPIPVISVSQDGELLPLLTLKSFSLWQGKQKSKKTTVLALIVVAFLLGVHSNGFFQAALSGKVIWFDTEQGESYAARTMKLILKLAGLEYSNLFFYCDLREYMPHERMEIIRAGIASTPDVKMVVIDGLVDLLTDFMDAAEGHAATTEILKLCSQYNIHIAGVLHQNKNDKNARAHIGTICSQKCELEIATEVDSNDRHQSIVSCVNSRGLPFEEFAIRWDKGSLPTIVGEWVAIKKASSKTAKNYDKAKEVAEAVFRPLASLSHSESINGIMNVSLKSKSSAKRMLDDFQEWGMVVQGPDKRYRRKTEEGSRFNQGSNEGS